MQLKPKIKYKLTMRKMFLQAAMILAGLTITFMLPSCGKDDTLGSQSGIQTGDTTVGIYVGYNPVTMNSALYELRFKYNHQVATDISAVVRFYIHNKSQKDIAFTIPAGNQNPKSEINGQYLNNWVYPGGSTDTATGLQIPTLINASWQIDSVKIIGVHTADKHYGFNVLGKNDSWSAYYKVQNPKTTIAFSYNNKPLHFESFDFEAGGATYSNQFQNYSLSYFNSQIQIITDKAAYPLQSGMEIDIPFMLFFDQKTYGGESDHPDGSNDTYSTIKLKISNVTDSHFDASFEGKLFSSRQPDTLYITEGLIKNAVLPAKQ
jgi:hypothetical protein